VLLRAPLEEVVQRGQRPALRPLPLVEQHDLPDPHASCLGEPMEIKLSFLITFTSGETATQDFNVPADPQHPIDKQTLLLMQQMLTQYSQVGLLRNPEGKKFVLICPSQIATVECELPAILIAGPNELPNSSNSPISNP
jgi:hypothetical protein